MKPKTLDEFKGQPRIKPLILTTLESCRISGSSYPHCLLAGSAGLGKTTLATAIAADLNSPFASYLGLALKKREDIDNIEKFISRGLTKKGMCDKCMSAGAKQCFCLAGYDLKGNVINPKLVKSPVVFVDEIHRIPSKIQEILYMMMEDRLFYTGTIDAKTGREKAWWIPHFTLIGATTLAGKLNKPFFDRFRLVLDLEPYSPEDCVDIVNATANEEGFMVDKNAAIEIGEKSGGIPRKIISLTKSVVDVARVNKCVKIKRTVVRKTLKLHGRDHLGLSRLSHQVMQMLYSVYPKGMGAENLAIAIDNDPKHISVQIEPKLIKLGFVRREARGRQLTASGVQYVEQFMSDSEVNQDNVRVVK